MFIDDQSVGNFYFNSFQDWYITEYVCLGYIGLEYGLLS